MAKSFQAYQDTEEKCLLVVDALNLAFRWKHSGATDFADDYLNTVKSLARSYNAPWVVIAADQGSSSYRKQIYPDYKLNRKEKAAQQTEAERAAFEAFFEDYQKTLELIRETTDFLVLQFKQTEADDIAAYIASLANDLPVEHVWNISSDKDWDLLVSEKVSRFSYVTRKEVTFHNWENHYDCAREDFISIKCLMGDSGDDVPGVPGIGPKRALELVQKYGTALDIVANIPIQSKLKYIQALNECGDQILLNYQLMDLVTFCQDALGDNCKIIKQELFNYINKE